MLVVVVDMYGLGWAFESAGSESVCVHHTNQGQPIIVTLGSQVKIHY